MDSLFDLIDTPTSPSHSDWRPPELPNLSAAKELYLDFETTGLKWWKSDRPVGVAIRTPEGQAWYLPTAHRAGGNLDEQQVIAWAKSHSGLKGKRITNLNTRFEVHMAREWGVDLDELGCEVSDVGHYAALLDDHRRTFSLESISQDYLGEGKIDLDSSRIANFHASKAEEYAKRDVELVHRLRDKMWPELDAQGLQRVRQLEDEVIYPVCEMERNGAPLDVELLKAWDKETEKALQQSFLKVHKETGLKVNPDRNADWEKLFNYFDIPITDFTETGRPSFPDSVLKLVKNDTVQVVRFAGKLADLRSKYIQKYLNTIDEDGILRYGLHPLRSDEGGTITGRFSSSAIKVNSEKIGANIQQVPAVKKQIAEIGDNYLIKELFGPWCYGCRCFAKYCGCPVKPFFLSADAKQIEYRLFGHFANSPKINEMYARDPDTKFHDMIWEMIRPFKPDILYKEIKNLNFATIYGAGLAKIALMMEFITESQFNQLKREHQGRGIPHTHPWLQGALEIKRIYDREIPEVKPLLAKASDMAITRGWVKTIMGRRSRFTNGQRAHKALNSIIQGSAADIMKRKLVEVYRTRKQTGVTMRMTVHDELVCDAPTLESARLVEAILNRQSFDLRIPILWDVKVGANWARNTELGKVA
jgi:DNA polymerase-1